MKKKYICGAIVAATVLCAAFCAVGCDGGNGGGQHAHTIEEAWSYDDYYHFHNASCGSVNHREDVALHEGDDCFCGYRAGGQGNEQPDLSGASEFGAQLTSAGILTFDDIQGACKCGRAGTEAGQSAAVDYDVARGKTTVNLGTLRAEGFPSGKSTVELVAYEMYTEEIEGETIEQEIPMDVKESFRVVKLNGDYSMRLLAYSDELVKLDGFVPEEDGDGNVVYTYEKLLNNNAQTSFNVSKYAKAASGCAVQFYRSQSDRENGENALGTFDLSATKIQQGENMFYMRAVNSAGGETQDYDLCVYGLASLKIKRYNLSFTTDDSGLRTFSQDKIGDDIEVVERDILTQETLYDGVAGGKIARDSGYNIFEKSDISVSADTADRFYDVYLYFYDEDDVRADKDEYDGISETFVVSESEYGISLRANNDASGSITVPYIVLGKRVIGASFGGYTDNTTITEVKFVEGFTAFVGSFRQCMGVTDIYLPSTITDMRDFAFGGDAFLNIKNIPDTATIHCAFAAKYASDNFSPKWNYIVGTVSSRYRTVYDSDPVGGSPITPGKGKGVIYRLDDGELTVTGYNAASFTGVIPESAEYEGQTYNVTSIESFKRDTLTVLPFSGNLVIGANITEIATNAFSTESMLGTRPASITVAEGNTAFAEEYGILYNAAKTRVIFAPDGDVFLPDTVTHIDAEAFGEYNGSRKIYLQASTANGIDYEWGNVTPVCGAYKTRVGDFVYNVFGQGESSYDDEPYAMIAGYFGDGGNVVIATDIDGIPVSRVAESSSGVLAQFEVVSLSVPLSLVETNSFNIILGRSGLNSVTSLTLTGRGRFKVEAVGVLTSLTSISVPDETSYTARDGVVYGQNEYSYEFGILYIIPNITGAVTVADGVTRIGGYSRNKSFAGTDITAITLPSSVTVIDYGAFEGCKALASVTLADGLTEIQDEAFKDCSALKSITIPSTVTTVGMGAFSGCVSLETVNLSATDATFYEQGGLFEYCAKLKTVYFAGTKEQFSAIEANFVRWSYIVTVKCSDGDYIVEFT